MGFHNTCGGESYFRGSNGDNVHWNAAGAKRSSRLNKQPVGGSQTITTREGKWTRTTPVTNAGKQTSGSDCATCSDEYGNSHCATIESPCNNPKTCDCLNSAELVIPVGKKPSRQTIARTPKAALKLAKSRGIKPQSAAKGAKFYDLSPIAKQVVSGGGCNNLCEDVNTGQQWWVKGSDCKCPATSRKTIARTPKATSRNFKGYNQPVGAARQTAGGKPCSCSCKSCLDSGHSGSRCNCSTGKCCDGQSARAGNKQVNPFRGFGGRKFT